MTVRRVYECRPVYLTGNVRSGDIGRVQRAWKAAGGRDHTLRTDANAAAEAFAKSAIGQRLLHYVDVVHVTEEPVLRVTATQSWRL